MGGEERVFSTLSNSQREHGGKVKKCLMTTKTRFIEKSLPVNIFGLMDEDILARLLDGYSLALATWVTVYYPVKLPVSIKTMGYIESKESRRFFLGVCREYQTGNGGDVCRRFQKKIALKYFQGEWKGPKLYRCHLHLWEMAYPLYVGERLLGIVLSGQIMVTDEISDWRQAVVRIKDEIVWDPFDSERATETPRESNQIEEICTAIDAQNDMVEQRREGLKNVLQNELKCKGLSVDHLLAQYRKFKDFIMTVLRILEDLYTAKKEVAMREFMQAAAQYLSEADFSTQQSWSKHCLRLCAAFCEVADIKRISVYTRSHSRFEGLVPYQEEKLQVIHAKYIVPVVPVGSLIRLSGDKKEEKEVLRQLGFSCMDDVSVYRTENRMEPSILASLVVVEGKNTDANRELVESFCRILGPRCDMASLIFRLQYEQDKFKVQVAEIAHSFRTPLQLVSLDLEDIGRTGKTNKRTGKLIEELKGRLIWMKEDIGALLEGFKERRGDYILVTLVEEVLNSLKAAVNNRRCLLVRKGLWPRGVIVRVNKNRIYHALAALVENAIKYSWGAHEIAIEVELLSHGLVRVIITNYGIGIPADSLAEIRGLGARAGVTDLKRRREGTGLGLPIAINILEDHGGWLEIESHPASNSYRRPEEKYHRFVTNVRAYLPIHKMEGVRPNG